MQVRLDLQEFKAYIQAILQQVMLPILIIQEVEQVFIFQIQPHGNQHLTLD